MWVRGDKEAAEVGYWTVSGYRALAVTLLCAGLPAIWGVRLCLNFNPDLSDGKLWLGSTIILNCIFLGAYGAYHSLKIERHAIRRERGFLVIESGGGQPRRVKFAHVTSVGLARVTRGPEREGGSLVVHEAGTLRDVPEKAQRARPGGSGVRLLLKSGETVDLGLDLGTRRTERLLLALQNRFGLPVEGF